MNFDNFAGIRTGHWVKASDMSSTRSMKAIRETRNVYRIVGGNLEETGTGKNSK
jgi:hypothetical protein